MRQTVRSCGDRLGPQRVHARAGTGIAPTRRDLLGHHTAQVVLDGDIVDHPVGSADVVQLDGAPVVVQRSRVPADAEHVAGGGVGLVHGGREHDRAGDARRQGFPRHRSRLRIDHRLSGLGLLGAPQTVGRERTISLETLDGQFGQGSEVSIHALRVEAEIGQELLELLDLLAVRALLQVDEGNDQVQITRAPVPAGHAEHREDVRGRLGRVQRGVLGGRIVPARPADARDHPEGRRIVPAGEPDPHVRFGADTGFGAAVVGVEDLLPGLACQRPAVGTPLAHPPAVTVADTAHDERDHLVVPRRRRRGGRAGGGEREEQHAHQRGDRRLHEHEP